MKKGIQIVLFLVFVSTSSEAQIKELFCKCETDTNYIESYRDDLIVRLYSSNKINYFRLKDTEQDIGLKFRPNDFYNLGIGFNYRSFGVNIGTQFPFSTRDEEEIGRTSTFGLQSYVYRRKFTIDLLAKSTRGYFLNDSEEYLPGYEDSDFEYNRRDIHTQNFGLNVNYIFNNERFSHRAAFKQVEKQKLSAGTLLAGIGLYSFLTSADSAIVPREINPDDFIKNRDFKGSLAFSVNLNVGYAYSWVFANNWLLTGSYILSGGVEHLRFRYVDQGTIQKLRPNFNSQFRVALSYQCERYMVGLSLVEFVHGSSLVKQDMSITNGSEFIRITVSHRIKFKKN